MRRLVSTFLSPLASAYALVVALIYVVSRPLRWWWALAAALLYVGAAVHAHARRARRARGRARRARRRAAAARAGDARGRVGRRGGRASSSRTRPSGPETRYTEEELEFLRENAAREGDESADPFSPGESSAASHLGTSATASRRSSSIRRGTGSGTRASSRSAPASTSRRASRRTPSSASTPASSAAAFVLWNLALLPRSGARGVDRRRVRDDAAARAADRRDRHPLARGRGLGRRRARRRPAPVGCGWPAQLRRRLVLPEADGVAHRPRRCYT